MTDRRRRRSPAPGGESQRMTHAYAPHPDAELIARIRAGDERAFEELFRRYYRELSLYAARIDPSEGSAEEIVQDVFFKVWQRRERLIEV